MSINIFNTVLYIELFNNLNTRIIPNRYTIFELFTYNMLGEKSVGLYFFKYGIVIGVAHD